MELHLYVPASFPQSLCIQQDNLRSRQKEGIRKLLAGIIEPLRKSAGPLG